MDFKPYDEFNGIEIEHSVRIGRAPSDLYLLWRRLEVVPRFISQIAEVRILDETRSRWVANGPLGLRLEWDSVLTREVPDREMEWQSVPGSVLPNAGSIKFNPVHGGTEVRVKMKYHLAGGRFGSLFARVFGKDPSKQLAQGLLEFKRMVEAEAGETERAA